MSAHLRRVLGTALAACLVLTPGALRTAAATGDTANYVGAGTAVARANGQPAADEGNVVCDDGNGVGVGGACLEFGGGDSVHVDDEAAGENVAFQVCIDNDGDGVCTSPDFSAPCGDQVFFSHDDNGAFYNPVGPLPTGFKPGCHGGAWKGYIVLLCEGAHVVGADAHAHGATSGSTTVTSGGEGLGTFCGGGPQPSRKKYSVGSGARYVSGGTAVVREDGQPAVDEGSVVCNNGDNVGVGGFCMSFGSGNAIGVFDDVAGTDVAFQVCVDNNADGVCTSPDMGTCADVVTFSHDDNGAFYNPVGPVPTGFTPGCGGPGAWDGYVVFVCQGTHVSGLGAHTHPATGGSGRLTSGGEGNGTFCGGSYAAPSRKPYRLDLNAPPRPHCRFFGFFEENTTGQNGEGAVEGSATAEEFDAPTGSPVSIRCGIRVNGTEVASSPTASGAGAASTAGRVTFAADETDVVEVCAFVTTVGGNHVRCTAVTSASSPPQEVKDAGGAAEQFGREFLDPAMCPFFATIAGTYGPVTINAQGDVFVNGQPVLDCPPYDLGVPPVTSQVDGVTLLTAGLLP